MTGLATDRAGVQRPSTEAAEVKAVDLVPELARHVLSKNGSKDAELYAEQIRSVAMFADLTGFSLFGAQFVAQSERGAEELRSLINAVFQRVVGVISNHGGSVLHYAGDAVTAVWPYAQGELGETTRRVIRCGLEIQTALKQLSAELGGQRLEMRASLAEGDVWVVHVPRTATGPQVLFCGEVLSTPAAKVQGHQTNGVMLSPNLMEQVAAALEKGVAFARDATGARVFSIDQFPQEPARRISAQMDGFDAYVPKPVRDLLGHSTTQWLGEFRSVQVLFARFPGFAFHGPADANRFSRLATDAIEALHRYGGRLIQLCTDDKGLVLIAGWGLATSSFENGAERALGAALAIAAAGRLTGREAVAAIATGKVFAGLVGAHPLFQYVMVGDAVNRAAGMAVAALDPVVVDEPTLGLVGRRYACGHAGDILLKGQAGPLPVFAPVEEALTAADHEGGLVGRVQERDRLEAMLARLQSGVASDVHIIGEAGLGKSRLAAWFEERLNASGLTPLRMNADSLRRTTGYTPWKQIFAPLLGLSAHAPAQECEAAARRLLAGDEHALALLPLLSPVLPHQIPDTEFTSSLAGAGRAESTREIMLKLLARALGARASGPPWVLLVEDAHWLDSASWQLIEAARRGIAGLSLLIVSRPLDPDDLPSETRSLFAPEAAEMLTLKALSREETANLIGQALNVVEAAAQIVDLVYREAEGHPLFTNALALSLKERKLIRVEGGYAHLRLGEAGLVQLTFPDSVEGVVAERISALAPARQLILKVASILGRHFDIETLAAVHPNAPDLDALRAELDAVAVTGLIERSSDGAGRYSFHHAIIADTAYRLLVTEQRRTLHLAAGRRIEELAAGNPEQQGLAMLAHHFERAEATDRALDYLARAADMARLGYNNQEVVDFFTRALLIAERLPEPRVDPLTLGDWKYKIAEALRALGQYQRAEDFLRASITILDRPPPSTGLQATMGILKGYATFRMRPHRAPQPDKVRRPILTAAAANMTLSEIHYELTSKIPFALAEILRGANLARQAGGDSVPLSKLYIGMALISTLLPWALDGDELQRQSLAIADRLGDPATASWVYMVSGVYETGKGGWAAGEEHLQRAREIGERCGERKNWETAMSCLGNLKRLEGRFMEAKGWSDLTLAATRDRGITHGIIWSHNGRARDLLCLSSLDEVRQEVAALEKLLNDPAKKQDSNDNNSLVYHYARIFCALDEGDDRTALTILDDLMAILGWIKRPQVYMVQNVDYYSDIIWSLWNRGHRGSLLAHQALITKSGRQVAKQYRTGAPMAELAAGDGAWYRGKRDQAVKHWLASAETARVRGMRYNQAHALFRLHETGLAAAGYSGPAWQTLIEELAIRRPAIWSLSAGYSENAFALTQVAPPAHSLSNAGATE